MIEEFRREVIRATGIFTYHARQVVLKIHEGFYRKGKPQHKDYLAYVYL